MSHQISFFKKKRTVFVLYKQGGFVEKKNIRTVTGKNKNVRESTDDYVTHFQLFET